MRPTLDITCGTDVVLNVRLIFRGETFDPSLSSEVEAYLVSGLGRRTAVDVDIIDDEAVVTIPWITGRLPGRYGLEVRGLINGLRWSTVADGLIRYTRGTMPGTTEPITVESDAYDISMEVSYRYGETPLEEVTATVDDGVGEPSVGTSYVSRKLRLEFHNLKGGEGVGFDHVEPTDVHTGDGETSTYTVKRTDGSDGGTIEVVNGRKGSQGDSAVFNPDDPETPSFEMANTLGGSTTKSMTQKAITEATIDYGIADYNAMSEPSYESSLILNGTGAVVSGQSSMRTYHMPVVAGAVVKIVCHGNEASTYGAGIGFSNKETPEVGDSAELFFPGITDADFVKTAIIPGNGYLWVGVKIGNSFDITFYSPVKMKDYVDASISSIEDTAEDAKEEADALNVDMQKVMDAIGSETDTTNILDPSQAIPDHSCNSEGDVVENTGWDVCPVNVEPGTKYYFYYDGDLSDLGRSARRAVDADGRIVASATNTAKSITIPEASEEVTAPVTLYVNYRNAQSSGTALDVNKIMVSTNGSLTEHHYYSAKVVGKNLPSVDPVDHTPTLHDDPLKEIISRPSRARIFPIWGVIGGSFETGYTNAFSDYDGSATQFYDNSERSEVPVVNGWGYEWPTLLTKLNHAILGNYAMAGHSFYWWLREYILGDSGKQAAKNFRNDGLMPQALILNMSGNEVGERGETGTGGYSASYAKYPAGLVMGTASSDIWNTDYTDVTMDTSSAHYLDGLTYCEMIASIVQLVRAKSPDCKIFFSTLRKDTSRHGDAAEYEGPMVTTFKNMQAITPNSYLIDLNQYGIDWGGNEEKNRYIRGSHPTRLGHIYLCDEFNTYIDWLIGSNPSAFRDAAYINTPYHL